LASGGVPTQYGIDASRHREPAAQADDVITQLYPGSQ